MPIQSASMADGRADRGDASAGRLSSAADVDIRRFDSPDERRTLEKGSFELVVVGGMTLGRASYEPGWKWSEHVGRAMGRSSCDVAHVGLVLSGRNRITMDDGRVFDIGPGDVFAISPGHDSEVVGDEPYVSLHLMGADAYAKR
jgi:hypothetical protein